MLKTDTSVASPVVKPEAHPKPSPEGILKVFLLIFIKQLKNNFFLLNFQFTQNDTVLTAHDPLKAFIEHFNTFGRVLNADRFSLSHDHIRKKNKDLFCCSRVVIVAAIVLRANHRATHLAKVLEKLRTVTRINETVNRLKLKCQHK